MRSVEDLIACRSGLLLDDKNKTIDVSNRQSNKIHYEDHKLSNSSDLQPFKLTNNAEEGIKRSMRLHHVFAISMNEIAPYIKASMMMLVHEITEKLRNLDPSSYGAGSDCGGENE